MFKRFFEMTEKEKCMLSEMCGKILRWIHEGQSTLYMAEQLKMDIGQVEYNIDEMLYVLMRHVGKKRFIKTLFMK